MRVAARTEGSFARRESQVGRRNGHLNSRREERTAIQTVRNGSAGFSETRSGVSGVGLQTKLILCPLRDEAAWSNNFESVYPECAVNNIIRFLVTFC